MNACGESPYCPFADLVEKEVYLRIQCHQDFPEGKRWVDTQEYPREVDPGKPNWTEDVELWQAYVRYLKLVRGLEYRLIRVKRYHLEEDVDV